MRGANFWLVVRYQMHARPSCGLAFLTLAPKRITLGSFARLGSSLEETGPVRLLYHRTVSSIRSAPRPVRNSQASISGHVASVDGVVFTLGGVVLATRS